VTVAKDPTPRKTPADLPHGVAAALAQLVIDRDLWWQARLVERDTQVANAVMAELRRLGRLREDPPEKRRHDVKEIR
jgi:hypothetical protein